MKRLLIDYSKMDHTLAAILIDSYPDGYGDEDIITIKKPGGEIIEAVELRTPDTLYLVKISKSLSNFMANFEEVMERELDRDMDYGPIDELEGESPVPDFETEDQDNNEGLC